MAIKIMKNALIIWLAISFFSCTKVEEMKIEYPYELKFKTVQRDLDIRGVKPEKTNIKIYQNGEQVVYEHQNDYFDDEFTGWVVLHEGVNKIEIKNIGGSNSDDVLLKEVILYVEKELSEEERITKVKEDSIAQAKAIIEEKEEIQFLKTKAGKIWKRHPEWSKEDCERIADGYYWVGMTIDMVKYQRGLPNSANPSNYGNGTQWQWCWFDYSPSCFYDDDNDGIIDSYN